MSVSEKANPIDTNACATPEPTKQHQWLQQMVGEWTAEMECVMGPDQPAMKSKGAETVRSLGGLWTLGEGSGETPDGGRMTSILTLGYDPQKQKFVGSFVASMMTHMWIYEGTLSADRKTLTMDTSGPSMISEGMVPYQDIFTIESPDHRTLSSRTPGPNGEWMTFMTAHYRRVK